MTTQPPDDAPTPVCPPTKWARGLTAAHAALADTQPQPHEVQDAARAAAAAATAAVPPGARDRDRPCHMTAGHPAHTWVDAPPQVPNPPFLWCLGKPCPDGRHRPDDDPTPGDRCKDCGRELTWRGPGPNDWDVADPQDDEPERERAAASDVRFGEPIGEDRPRCQDPACPDFGDPDFGEGTCPESHAARTDPERTATGLLAYLLGQYERAVDIHAQVRMDTDEDRRLHADAVAALRDAADPIARFLARAELPADEPDDGGPFRPRWPLLVSEDTKRALLAELAEVVHAQDPPGGDPRAIGPAQSFRRGYETGMAKVMLMLGINEAGSPERASLPAPDDATNQPPDPAPDVHLPGDEFTPECGAAPDASTRLTVEPHLVTCPACLTILREDGR